MRMSNVGESNIDGKGITGGEGYFSGESIIIPLQVGRIMLMVGK